jgi:hypothetical protein
MVILGPDTAEENAIAGRVHDRAAERESDQLRAG